MDRMSLLIMAASSALIVPAQAADLDPWQAPITEAAQRFAVPAAWIRAVIQAESGGNAKAVSPKGAMGLMQIMPASWADMRAKYALGGDPFDPRTNILAGTAILKMMETRFGYPALFAAYNAGAARYEQFLRTGKSLPAESLAYLAKLDGMLSDPPGSAAKIPNGTGPIVSGTALFFRLSKDGSAAPGDERSVPSHGLFVSLALRKGP